MRVASMRAWAQLLLLLLGLPACEAGPLAATADAVSASDTATAEDGAADVAADGTADGADAGPPEGTWTPTSAQDLYGKWANQEEGTVRAFEFAGFSPLYPDLDDPPVYFLYRYDTGAAPQMIQRGGFKMLLGPKLRLVPTWNADGTPTGIPTEVALLPTAEDQIALELLPGSGEARAYSKVAVLP